MKDYYIVSRIDSGQTFRLESAHETNYYMTLYENV